MGSARQRSRELPPPVAAPVLVSNALRKADPLFVGSLEKGLKVLECFSGGETALSLTEICRLAQLDKSAAQRFTHTLMTLGYLEKDERTKRYAPSARVLDWSVAYMRSDRLIQSAGPYLVNLHEETRQAVNLSRLIATDVMYVVRIPARRARLLSPIVGERVPAFCTASGRAILSGRTDSEVADLLDRSTLVPFTARTICDRKAILARIAEVRRTGYAIAEEECLPGELTIAAPILNGEGRSIGGVNMSMTTRDWTVERMRGELAPILLRTAADLSNLPGNRA